MKVLLLSRQFEFMSALELPSELKEKTRQVIPGSVRTLKKYTCCIIAAFAKI